jgi:hypothetical protein
METASIGVDAESEADVRAVVLGEDGTGLFLEDFELGGGRLAQVLDPRRGPRVRGVGDPPDHGRSLGVNPT